jgi:hypothetical protein
MGSVVVKAPESVPAEPPPSLRASVRGIRAWARENVKLLLWLGSGLGVGGGATALRDQITTALGLAKAADLTALRAELEVVIDRNRLRDLERGVADRERQREIDRLRSDQARRDDQQDSQIERARRRAYEPEPMRVTPRD